MSDVVTVARVKGCVNHQRVVAMEINSAAPS